MSLPSCELNNNFNEVAGCLNARLNRTYILPLPSVSLSLSLFLYLSVEWKKYKPPLFRKEYKLTLEITE